MRDLLVGVVGAVVGAGATILFASTGKLIGDEQLLRLAEAARESSQFRELVTDKLISSPTFLDEITKNSSFQSSLAGMLKADTEFQISVKGDPGPVGKSIQIQSGLLGISASGSHSLVENEALWAHDQSQSTHSYEGEVKFNTPFSGKPQVLISLNLLDDAKAGRTTIAVDVLSVTNNGFKYRFRNWHEAKIFAVRASWLAYR